jgi:rubrerythrin
MAHSKTHETIETLKELIQLDADAVQLYEKAIEHVDLANVKGDLEGFKSDHVRHIDDLSALVGQLGGEAPMPGRDLKGVVLEAMTALRSVTGTKGALKAMRMNEKLTNKIYEKATQQELPEQVAVMVALNLEDERRHLQTIEMHLQTLAGASEDEENVGMKTGVDSGVDDEQRDRDRDVVVVVEEERVEGIVASRPEGTPPRG